MSKLPKLWALCKCYFWILNIVVWIFWRSRKSRMMILSWLFWFSWSFWVSSKAHNDLLKMAYPQNGFSLVDSEQNENGFVCSCRVFSSGQWVLACVHHGFFKQRNISRATHDSLSVPITGNWIAESFLWMEMASPDCTSEASKFRGLSNEGRHQPLPSQIRVRISGARLPMPPPKITASAHSRVAG